MTKNFFLTIILIVFGSICYGLEQKLNIITSLSSFDNVIQLNAENSIIASTNEDLSIEQALSTLTFVPFDTNFTFDKKQHWIRILVQNDLPKPVQVLFNSGYNDVVKMYCYKNGSILDSSCAGYLVDNQKLYDPSKTSINKITVPPNGIYTLLIHQKAFLTYHQEHLFELIPNNIYIDNIEQHNMGALNLYFNVFFFGSVSFAFIFVLFLFYYHRNILFFFYALYLFAVVLFSLSGIKNFPILSSWLGILSPLFYLYHEPTLFLLSGLYGLFVMKLLDIKFKTKPKLFLFL